MARLIRLLLVIGLVLSSSVLFAPTDRTVSAASAYQGRYIVLLDPNTNSRVTSVLLARSERFFLDHVYEHALKGFSARLTPNQAIRISQYPGVLAVEPDVRIDLVNQQIPWGIERIGTLNNATANIDGIDDRVNVDVAVLDTGIANHPDLNIAGGYNCMSSNTAAYHDGHGHGTHVAGTIGALDNGIGVVGVAPGARLWAVKVLNDSGSGSFSALICGFDWVTANSHTIDVANLSASGTGSDTGNCGYNGRRNSDLLHQAVCATYSAGVPIAVAAGNSNRDAGSHVPAAYPQTITVGATDQNDNRAWFSNYGSRVNIYAPGLDVLSTIPGNNYDLKSGTSMASPHVAGAAALYLAENPGTPPAQVLQALLDHSVPTTFGPRRVNVGTFAPAAPPDPVHDVAVTSVSAPGAVTTGTTTSVTVRVDNVGNQNESSIQVALTANGVAVGSTQTIALNAQQGQDVAFSWTPVAQGNVNLIATASIADDANTSNNTHDTTWVTVADAVHDVEVTAISAPGTVTQDQGTTVQVTVRNNGDFVENVTVTLSSNAANANVNPAQQAINNLGIGQSQTVSFTWTPSTSTGPGGYQLTATASISATDATPANNSRQHAITVLEKPSIQNVYVHSLTGNSSLVSRSYVIAGQVEIRTASGAPAPNAVVTIHTAGSRFSDTQTVTTNANGVASYSVSVARGNFTISVTNVSGDGYQYAPATNNVTSISVST